MIEYFGYSTFELNLYEHLEFVVLITIKLHKSIIIAERSEANNRVQWAPNLS